MNIKQRSRKFTLGYIGKSVELSNKMIKHFRIPKKKKKMPLKMVPSFIHQTIWKLLKKIDPLTWRKTLMGWRPQMVLSYSDRYCLNASGSPVSIISMPILSKASIDLYMAPCFLS